MLATDMVLTKDKAAKLQDALRKETPNCIWKVQVNTTDNSLLICLMAGFFDWVEKDLPTDMPRTKAYKAMARQTNRAIVFPVFIEDDKLLSTRAADMLGRAACIARRYAPNYSLCLSIGSTAAPYTQWPF